MMNFKTEEEAFAWCAGFFEGEGCFSRGKSRKRNDGTQLVWLRADVGQKDRGLLEIFRDIVGFGTIYGNSSRDMHHWITITKGDAAKLLILFEGMLSERRLETAAAILREEEESRRYKRVASNMGRIQVPECEHPNQKYKAKTQCESCYAREYYLNVRRYRETKYAQEESGSI